MKKNFLAMLILFVVVAVTSFSFGCTPKAEQPTQKLNYLFTMEGMSEQTLKQNDHVDIFALGVGTFLEEEIKKNNGKLDYKGNLPFEIAGKNFKIDITASYDCNAPLVNGVNLSLGFLLQLTRPGTTNIDEFQLKNDAFHADMWKGEELRHFENSPSILSNFLQIVPNDITKQLSFVFSILSWEATSLRYGKKIEHGEEVGELLVTINLFRSMQNLLRAMLLHYKSGHTSAEIDDMRMVLNNFSIFVFGVPYEDLSTGMPTIFLNLDVIMRGKIAKKIGIAFSTSPLYEKKYVVA